MQALTLPGRPSQSTRRTWPRRWCSGSASRRSGRSTRLQAQRELREQVRAQHQQRLLAVLSGVRDDARRASQEAERVHINRLLCLRGLSVDDLVQRAAEVHEAVQGGGAQAQRDASAAAELLHAWSAEPSRLFGLMGLQGGPIDPKPLARGADAPRAVGGAEPASRPGGPPGGGLQGRLSGLRGGPGGLPDGVPAHDRSRSWSWGSVLGLRSVPEPKGPPSIRVWPGRAKSN